MSELNHKMTSSIFDFTGSVTRAEVAKLMADPNVKTVQTKVPAESSTWDFLNRELFQARPDIELRLYGFYSDTCDLRILRQTGNVRHLVADCLMTATGVENIASLTKLESLSVGIYDLDSFAFLDSLPCEQIVSLSLQATASKRPALRSLERFTNLTTLSIEGHKKDIEVIGSLKRVEDLTLRSIGPVDLSFLQSLTDLWSLDIKLGGIRDLSGLANMDQLLYLELWQVKGLSDLSVISTLRGLQFLFLQSMINVVRLPDFSDLKDLRRVHCENMNGLTDLSSLSTTSVLQEVFFSTTRGQEPEEYEWIVKLDNLWRATVTLGSLDRNERFKKIAARYGVEEYRQFAPFEYL